jgi:hypothetical protein
MLSVIGFRIGQYLPFLIFTLLLHGLILMLQTLAPAKEKTASTENRQIKLRSLGIDQGQEQVPYLSFSESPKAKRIEKDPYMERVKKGIDQMEMRQVGKNEKEVQKMDLSKLDFNPTLDKGELKRAQAMRAIQLQGEEIQNFIKGSQNRYMRSQNSIPTLKNSQIAVLLDVPQGVQVDELNQLEEMFYSFQKRMALTYINSFFNKLANFELRNPHLQFPMTNAPVTLTAKVTFDHLGNIQTIKAVRWSEDERLQDFFLQVIDGIESLPNPPKQLVQNDKTFSVYYTLNIN